MRIAIVAEPYVPIPPSQYGGTEQVIYYLIKGLKEAGHTPILLGTGDSTVDCELIPIVDKALYFAHSKKELAAHEKLVKKAYRKINQELIRLQPTIDVIHSHGYDMHTSRLKDFPSVTTMHNPVDLNNLNYYLARKDLSYISISKNQQASCPELDFAGVVYNGEDPADFPFVAKPDDYLCFLGRFDRGKSPHLAIQLAISLGMKIKLAGKIDHDSEGYFEEEIEKYLKHPLVEYLGELGFEDKVKLIAHAKCNLHPINFREPFGLTVIESAYCGTPTLAVARGSMPELIEHGRTGMIVEDFIEGRFAIHDCFKMDRRYIASRASMLFSYKKMAQEYAVLYEKIISEYALHTPDELGMIRLIYKKAKSLLGFTRTAL